MKSFRFVTYCTPDYLMYAFNAMQSAVENHPLSKGNIVCVGPVPRNFQGPMADIQVYELHDFSYAEDAFTKSLQSKNELESLISIKPKILMNFLETIRDSEILVYLDTDVYFFHSLDEFQQLNPEADFIVFQHMYPTEPPLFPYGKYNAGLIVIRKSPQAFEILREWEKRCDEWCHLRRDQDRYADQGYLEELITMPRGKGVDSSTINVGMHYLIKGPKVTSVHGKPYIADQPLVAFHFHGIKIRGKSLWTGLNRYGFSPHNLVIYRIIYKPMIEKLIQSLSPNFRNQNHDLSVTSRPKSTIEFVRRLKRTVVKISNQRTPNSVGNRRMS